MAWCLSLAGQLFLPCDSPRQEWREAPVPSPGELRSVRFPKQLTAESLPEITQCVATSHRPQIPANKLFLVCSSSRITCGWIPPFVFFSNVTFHVVTTVLQIYIVQSDQKAHHGDGPNSEIEPFTPVPSWALLILNMFLIQVNWNALVGLILGSLIKKQNKTKTKILRHLCLVM